LGAVLIGATVIGAGIWSARADEPTDRGATGLPRAGNENLQDWQWYLEIPEGKAGDAKYYDFIVPPAVFDRANATNDTISDLRLRDARDREIPYALFVRRSEDRQEPLDGRRFNETTDPNHVTSVSVDLQKGERKHNQIEIITSGENFRRRVLVESSDDNSTWNPLLERDLIFFQAGAQTVDVHKFSYPENRRRYLRVTVHPDSGKKDDRPEIKTVTVSDSVVVKGEDVNLPVQLGNRQGMRQNGQYATAWDLDFGKRVPVEKLNFEVQEEVFERPYRLEMPATDEAEPLDRFASPFVELQQGLWKRRPDQQRKPLEIRLQQETFARQMRLVIGDANNPPLNVTSVQYQAPARQVIFARSSVIAWPVKLYFGNPKAQNPAYDFEKTVSPNVEPAPIRLEIAASEPVRNPTYQAPPVPWSEQHPWLVYVVLGIASAVLLGIMGMLGKQALMRTPQPT
jgi:hypothetical protein